VHLRPNAADRERPRPTRVDSPGPSVDDPARPFFEDARCLVRVEAEDPALAAGLDCSLKPYCRHSATLERSVRNS